MIPDDVTSGGVGSEYGLELILSGSFVSELENADKKYEEFVQKSNKKADELIEQFKKISSEGVDALISKLNSANATISATNVGSVGNGAAGAASEVIKLVEAVNELITVLQTAGKSGGTTKIIDPEEDIKRIAELKKEIREINTLLNRGGEEGNPLNLDTQQELVNKREALKEQLKLQQQSFEQQEQQRKKELANSKKLYEEKVKLYKKTNDAYNRTYKGAIEFSLDAKTFDREKRAIDYLTSARNNLTKADADYATKLNTLNSAIREHEENIKRATRTEEEQAAIRRKNAEEASRTYAKRVQDVQDKWYSSNDTRAMAFSDNAETYNEEKRAIEYLTEARNKLSKSDSEYATKLNALNEKIREHQENLKRAGRTDEENAELAKKNAEQRRQAAERETQAYERRKKAIQDKWYSSNADRAIKFSSNANTINEEIQAIKYLTAARDNLSKSDDNYKQKLYQLNSEILRHKNSIEDARKGASRLEEQHRGLMNTSEQLQRRIALLFSVSAITGYMRKLVEVRGELELQQVALQSILRDREKANEVWAQIQQLALQSPFTLMQLTAYTKQLAAYQVESNKLVETTKRLADVSAGLGVEMGRIILAYGQVKAANYLRSAEIRQFTEAGINMLGELSKMYSELEGRMVTVGEVQERVQKRMVSFGDVEEVFRRLTDVGGMFYNMQERQSETLKGMVAKLQDAFDIMLNDIGKANDGVLKGILQQALNIVQSWKDIQIVAVPLITTLIARFALLKSATAFMGTGGLLKNLKEAIVLIRLAGTNVNDLKFAFGSLYKAIGGLGGVLTIISAIITVIWSWKNAMDAANQEAKDLARVVNEQYLASQKSVSNYKRLVSIIQDQTKTYKEQKDALEELNRTYGDILPAEMLEMENIRKIGNNYGEAEQAIRSYYETIARNKQLEIISENEGKDVQNRTNKIVNSIINNLKRIYPELSASIDKADVRQKVARLQQDIESGNVKTLNDAKNALKGYLEELYGVNVKSVFESGVGDLLDDFISDVNEYNAAIESVEKSNAFSGWITYTGKQIKGLSDTFEQESARISQALNVISAKDATSDQVAQARDELNKLFTDMGKQAPDWASIINDPFKLNDAILETNKLNYEKYIKSLEGMKANANPIQTAEFDKAIQDAQRKLDSLKPTQFQEAINTAIQDFASTNEIALKGMDNLIMKSGETIDAYGKRIKETLESTQNEIKQAELNKGFFPSWTPENQESLNNNQQLAKVLEYIVSLIVSAQSKTKSGSDANQEELRRLKERIKLVQDAKKRYDELNKTLSATEAAEETIKAYSDSFKEAGILSLITKDSIQDANYVIEEVKKIPNTVGGKYAHEAVQAINKAIGEEEVNVKIKASKDSLDALKKNVEEMFDQYDLYKQLEDMDFPPDLASRMFGISVTSLDQLRDSLGSLQPKFVGTDAEKAYDEFLKKIQEKDEKAQLERIKKYGSYLTNALSERAKIYLDEARQYQEVADEMAYTDEERERIRVALHKKTQEDIAKLDWKEFQNSGLYLNVFEDMDKMSTRVIEDLLARMRELKESLKDLPADQVRAIMRQIENLENTLEKRNPFKGFVQNIGEYIKALGKVRQLESRRAEQSDIQKQADAENKIAQQTLAIAKQEYETAIKKNGLDSQEATLAKKMYDVAQKRADVAKQNYENETNTLNAIIDEIKAAQSLKEKLAVGFGAFGDFLGQISSNFGTITENLEQIFGTFDQGTQDTLTTIGEFIGGLSQMSKGIQQIMSGDVIGGTISTLTGFTSTIASIFRGGDRKREREIQRELELVDRLQKAYEKLQQKIESAYAMNTFNAAQEEARANLQATRDALERAYAAEDAKKKTDKNKLKEYQEQIQTINEQLAELEQSRMQALGALGGENYYKDAAQGFVDAWLSAYRETGNGLEGLKDQFNNFMDDWFVKQATLRIAGEMLRPLFEMIDAAVGGESLGGGNLVREEIDAIRQRANELFPTLSSNLEQLFNALGMGASTEGTLSGLQRGIQSITEETALVIEAYLNSVRFFVSDSNDKLTQLLDAFTNPETPNPILNELRIQSEILRTIRDTISSVVARGAFSGGGAALKIVMS